MNDKEKSRVALLMVLALIALPGTTSAALVIDSSILRPSGHRTHSGAQIVNVPSFHEQSLETLKSGLVANAHAAGQLQWTTSGSTAAQPSSVNSLHAVVSKPSNVGSWKKKSAVGSGHKPNDASDSVGTKAPSVQTEVVPETTSIVMWGMASLFAPWLAKRYSIR